MGKIYAYLRVSTDKQDLSNQRLEILEWAHKVRVQVDEFFEVEMSSRRSEKDRRLDELVETLQPGDTLVVSELSRLGRSTIYEALKLIETLVGKGVELSFVRQPELSTKDEPVAMRQLRFAIYSYFAATEREYISARTKAGLARARAEGKQLGRPKGRLGKSRLDGKEDEIVRLLGYRVPAAAIARVCGVSRPALQKFILSRGLAVPSQQQS